MNSRTAVLNAKPALYLAAAVASTLLSGPAQARDPELTVELSVNTAGLNVNTPAGARILYGRLRQAARAVCGSGDRVGLQPVADFPACYEKALGDAVHSINRPELTLAYMTTHTLQDAAAHGIEVPARMARR